MLAEKVCDLTLGKFIVGVHSSYFQDIQKVNISETLVGRTFIQHSYMQLFKLDKTRWTLKMLSKLEEQQESDSEASDESSDVSCCKADVFVVDMSALQESAKHMTWSEYRIWLNCRVRMNTVRFF